MSDTMLHLRLSGRINMLINIRNYLIEQFHSKKMVMNKKSSKYETKNKDTVKYYNKFLFLKEIKTLILTSFHAF